MNTVLGCFKKYLSETKGQTTTPVIHVLYNILRGKPIDHGFTLPKNKNKLVKVPDYTETVPVSLALENAMEDLDFLLTRPSVFPWVPNSIWENERKQIRDSLGWINPHHPKENKSGKNYVYVLVRNDLSPEQQMVQAVHSALLSRSHLVNYGTHVIIYGVNKDQIQEFKERLTGMYHFDAFCEPWKDTGLTSICLSPLEEKPEIFENLELARFS